MKDFAPYFQQYLEQLCREVEAYPSDEAVWQVVEGISNSSGTLVLHLIGNLNHFIGHGLGNSGYVRDRVAEFNTRGTSRLDLVREIKNVMPIVDKTLLGISDPSAPYPEELFGKTGTISYFTCKLLTHLSYHVGQVNYHRRILTTTSS